MADGLIAELRAARVVPVVRTRDRRHAATAAFVGMGGALVDEKRIAAGDRAAIETAARQVLGCV